MNASLRKRGFAIALATLAALVLAGCDSLAGYSPTKRIDYKSAATGPALELPPDLTTPRYDDRYRVNTATGLAAAGSNKESRTALLPQTPDAKIMRAGNERWLVVKATPEQAWNTTREFWQESGFVLAVENPQIGFMETDFAENRADAPTDIVRKTLGKVLDAFYSTYKQDKFRTRIERGAEPGTVEIYISHRGMEQVPTAKIDNSSPAAFVWAVMPPNPALESEMLTRLMMKFGTPEPAARTAVVEASIAPDRATIEKNPDGSYKLTVQDPFDRTWRRVGLALDRGGFTVVDRDRSRGVYFVRYGDPDALAAKANQAGILDKLMFWKADEKDKPEQYQIVVAEAAQNSVVSVQDPGGVPDRTAASQKILALLKDQLK
ncbi:MAG: outer membrane protein assembly factor BamC [Burkholderiales bacterium]|nr:outer membrane protein assembly factor BamC [Burkholderiales bacterium]